MESKISLDNGRSYMTAHEAIEHIKAVAKVAGISFEMLWDSIAWQMDDEIREAVHAELSPCSAEEFLQRYLELSGEDLII